jgi:hypothetical protein
MMKRSSYSISYILIIDNDNLQASMVECRLGIKYITRPYNIKITVEKYAKRLQDHRCTYGVTYAQIYILWRICPMKELLSHGNLETRTQQYNYEYL